MKTSLLMFILFMLFPLMTQSQDKPKPVIPADKINSLAADARDNSDANIKALADAAIHPFGVPEPVAEQFRVSVVAAEQRYRQGKGKGVTEEELVQFHNRVVKALKLPDFAETDQRQIRDLRLTLQELSPALMAQQKHDPARHEMDSEMSPLQAAHLESMMVFQKYMSPMYQFHPKDWSVETANKIQKEGHHLDPTKFKVKPEDDKSTQFLNGFTKGINELSVAQGIEIAQDARKTFKF